MSRFPIHRIQSPDFCPELWKIPQPPRELYIQGSDVGLQLLRRLPSQGLAIVGTRQPQARSLTLVKKSIHELAGSPLIILSGLARGIDSAAHQASVEAGIPTIAVLGTGHHSFYPRENEELRQKILSSNGLIISEYSPDSAVRSFQFLQRNRLIAGWANATWVVEAPYRSGALNTARWARDQDRTCFTVPCFPGDPALSGNQILLDRDHALSFWGTHSLGAVWIELATLESKRRTHQQILSPDEKIVIQRIQQETGSHGGAHLQDLLNECIERGWEPARFFTTIQAAMEKGEILDQKGILTPGLKLPISPP